MTRECSCILIHFLQAAQPPQQKKKFELKITLEQLASQQLCCS